MTDALHSDCEVLGSLKIRIARVQEQFGPFGSGYSWINNGSVPGARESRNMPDEGLDDGCMVLTARISRETKYVFGWPLCRFSTGKPSMVCSLYGALHLLPVNVVSSAFM